MTKSGQRETDLTIFFCFGNQSTVVRVNFFVLFYVFSLFLSFVIENFHSESDRIFVLCFFSSQVTPRFLKAFSSSFFFSVSFFFYFKE